MGAMSATLEAPTMEELEEVVKEWLESATSTGVLEEQVGWNPERVKATDNGYSIFVRART